MTLENPLTTDGLAGETFLCLIGDQFARQKWGDRYFYDLGHQKGSFDLRNIFNFIKDCLLTIQKSIFEIGNMCFYSRFEAILQLVGRE